MEINFEQNSHISIMHSNQLNFDEVERGLIKEAKEMYGDDILENIYLPEDFEFFNLKVDDAKKFDLQQIKLPLGNQVINDLIKMPKILVNEVFCFNNNGKTIHGSYLVGKHQGKYCLFLLKIEKSCEHKDFSKYSIKLDACIQGKAWITLMRLDSIGKDHPNYITPSGQVVSGPKDFTKARCPHLHIQDYYTQVLSDTKSYTLAKELPFYDYNNDKITDKGMFKKIVDYFLSTANIKAKINELVQDDYLFSNSQPLFDYDTPVVFNPKDLDGMEM